MILFILICLIIRLNTAYETGDIDSFVIETRSSVTQTFTSFFDKMKTFLKCKYKSILHRRELAKSAFNKFIAEAFNKNRTLVCPSNSSGTVKKPVVSGNTKEEVKVPKPPETVYVIRENAEEMSIAKLVALHGYRVETHTTLTTDGYIITLHRILLKDFKEREMKKILLHHGLLGSSEDWLLLGSYEALPYFLCMLGYDVWLTNARGNKFSRTHSRFPVDSMEFWDFSFHEIGIYDLPAAIDYIKEKSDSNTKLHYIGYSMGASALLVLLSTFPRYNKILDSAILIAPLAFMYNAKGPIRLLIDFNPKIFNAADYLGGKDFVAQSSLPLNFLYHFCKGDLELCSNPLLLFANSGKDIPNKNIKESVTSYSMGGGSAKTIKHYVQLIQSGQFQMFDYGPVKNLKKYGMKSPPSYRLNEVTLPVAVISSVDDWLATIPDVVNLLPFFSHPIIHHVVQRNDFGHTDFLWADDALQLVYNVIINILTPPNVTLQDDNESKNLFFN